MFLCLGKLILSWAPNDHHVVTNSFWTAGHLPFCYNPFSHCLLPPSQFVTMSPTFNGSTIGNHRTASHCGKPFRQAHRTGQNGWQRRRCSVTGRTLSLCYSKQKGGAIVQLLSRMKGNKIWWSASPPLLQGVSAFCAITATTLSA